MLPKRLRLSRRAFSASIRGKRAMSVHFSVTSMRVSSEGGGAAIISKKIARRSVDRHLLKRRILAVIRPWCAQHHSLIVYARAGSPTLSFRAIQEELTVLLEQLIGRPVSHSV